jgi:predicted RNase H-like nuclease (RuvC/YqgF family)
MSSKINKAAAVRNYQAENPNAKPKEVAAAVGCDVTYVYLVNNKERKKQSKAKVTRGQEVLRQEFTQHQKQISEMEKLLHDAQEVNHSLNKEVRRLNIIIQWLEGRLRGTSV